MAFEFYRDPFSFDSIDGFDFGFGINLPSLRYVAADGLGGGFLAISDIAFDGSFAFATHTESDCACGRDHGGYEEVSPEYQAKLNLVEAATFTASKSDAAEGGSPDFMGADIAGDTSTSATLAIGGSQTSEIEVEGDEDWFAVQLEAGQSYRFTMTGSTNGGTGTLLDPKMAIHDANGVEIQENDDSNGLNSAINFKATTSGTYYINANSFTGNTGQDIGTYTVSASILDPVTEVRTLDGVANFLTDEYGTREAFAEDTITYNVEGLTIGARLLAERALTAWADITDLTFVRVTTSNALITFEDDDGDAESASAFATTTNSGTLPDGTSRIVSATVNVDSDWFGGTTALDSYTYQTYLHEVGHALGLGHAGPYNSSAEYGLDNVYVNDSWAYTVMSYFDQNESGFGDYRFVLGPAIADIIAIQDLYGANPNGTNTGNTVYGFNSTETDVNDWSQFTSATGVRPPSMAIYDTGGIDTIDLSGFSQNQTLSLIPETFSDLGDRGTGDSYSSVISIARGTIIENAVGGSGNDTITGNSAANTITLGAGSDTYVYMENGGADIITDFSTATDKIDLTAFSQSQGQAAINSAAAVSGGTLITLGTGQTIKLDGVSPGALSASNFQLGEPGENEITEFDDVIDGTMGDDVIDVLGGNDTLNGLAGNDTLDGSAGNDRITGGFGDDLIDGGSGQDTAVFNFVSTNAAVVRLAEGVIVGGQNGEGRDVLTNVETLAFNDLDRTVESYSFFPTMEYIASNEDLILALGPNTGNGVNHYVRHGFFEGRQEDTFDEAFYLASNADLISVYGQNIQQAAVHYVAYGYGEGRALKSFDALAYQASNTQVLQMFGTDQTAAAEHYVTTGFGQNLSTNSFDGLRYIASHGDLIGAFGVNARLGLEHYAQNGYFEARSTTLFDAAQYLENNPDVQSVFGNDLIAATNHYIQYGFSEGRSYQSSAEAAPFGLADKVDSSAGDEADINVDQAVIDSLENIDILELALSVDAFDFSKISSLRDSYQNAEIATFELASFEAVGNNTLFIDSLNFESNDSSFDTFERDWIATIDQFDFIA